MSDRYEIATQLEEDVLGTVYLADDVMLKRRVMLRKIEFDDAEEAKKRDESWRKDFAKYAGMLGAAQHPNMLTIYDVSIQDDGANVVTQFIEGEPLVERLEQGPIRQVGVFRMADDLLDAMHAAHKRKVFHGALHTGSVVRVSRASGGHRYLVVDLGLNQLASMVKGKEVTVADLVLRAPELHEEGRRIDEQADLFMIGQLCYTALVGGHPFAGKSSEECLEAYQADGMPHIRDYVEDVDSVFADWIMRLVASDPEKRPKDTGEAMRELHKIELSEPEPNVPGETHAIPSYTSPDELVEQAEPATAPAVDPVHEAAANSAAASQKAANMTHAQQVAGDGGKKIVIACAIAAILIVAILCIVLFSGAL